MRRLHLFEFNDQAWLPAFVTGWMTNVLRHGHEGSKDGDAHLTLTDLIPNLSAAEAISRRGGDAAYLTRSIDAWAAAYVHNWT